MVKLPEPKNRTATAIYARYERDAEDWRRDHLGASVIGKECARDVWYSFRWASNPNFEGRLLRLFSRGDREEELIVNELRGLGMRVEVEDPETGKQYRFEALGGHFGGGCDGAVLGVFEAPKTWHLLEVKTSNEKRFKELEKDGVAASNPQHYDQMQTYMHGLGLKRALYVCVCKNDDRIYTERINYDCARAETILRIAETIVGAPEPLSRISEDPSWFKCKFCDHYGICHLEQAELLERNCRTCLSSTALPNGNWHCEHHDVPLDSDAQRKGCEDHLFIPKLLPWEVKDVDDRRRLITYDMGGGSTVTDTGTGLVPT